MGPAANDLHVSKNTSYWLQGGTVIAGIVGCTESIRFDHHHLGWVLGALQHVSVAKTLAVILGKNEQHERVYAAVGVAETDADVVGVDKGNSGGVVGQIEHLNDMVRRPADQEQADNHEDHLGGSFSPNWLLPFDAADGAEDVVEGEWVEGADDDERYDKAQDGLVESVPVHVLRTIQVHHAHLQMLSLHDLGVQHDRDSEEETAQPHQQIDDDGPLDGPLLWGGVDNSYVPMRKKSFFKARPLSETQNAILSCFIGFVFILDRLEELNQAKRDNENNMSETDLIYCVRSTLMDAVTTCYSRDRVI